MTPAKTPTTFRLDDALIDGMQRIKERDGIPLTEQVTLALRMWLEKMEVKVMPSDVSRQLLERLSGVGRLLDAKQSAKVIAEKAEYGLNVWQEIHRVRTFSGESTVEGLKDIQGQIRIVDGSIGRLVGESLVLELADGQLFPFFFTDSSGAIAAQGAIAPPKK